MYKHLSASMLTANTTVLLGLLARNFDTLDIPITVLRVSLLLGSVGLAFVDKTHRKIFGAIAGGINIGTALAYWDEMHLLYKYRFAETFLVPMILVILLIPVVSSLFAGYAHKKYNSGFSSRF